MTKTFLFLIALFAFSGAVNAQLFSRPREAINVASYGAVPGDAVDDTARIQAAINRAAALGVNAVYLPGGEYIISQITLPSFMCLFGDGMDVTVLKLANTAGLGSLEGMIETADFLTNRDAWSYDPASPPAGVHLGVRIFDLTLDGNSANNGTGSGIRLYGGRFQIDRVSVHHTADHGIWTEVGDDSVSSTGGSDAYNYLNMHESQFGFVQVAYAGKHGWFYRGPNDSYIEQYNAKICGWAAFYQEESATTFAGMLRVGTMHAYSCTTASAATYPAQAMFYFGGGVRIGEIYIDSPLRNGVVLNATGSSIGSAVASYMDRNLVAESWFIQANGAACQIGELWINDTIDANQWAALTAYSVGDTVFNGGNVYICTTAGTSAASGGPSGTGSGISDGSCVWNYTHAAQRGGWVTTGGSANDLSISNLRGGSSNIPVAFVGLDLNKDRSFSEGTLYFTNCPNVTAVSLDADFNFATLFIYSSTQAQTGLEITVNSPYNQISATIDNFSVGADVSSAGNSLNLIVRNCATGANVSGKRNKVSATFNLCTDAFFYDNDTAQNWFSDFRIQGYRTTTSGTTVFTSNQVPADTDKIYVWDEQATETAEYGFPVEEGPFDFTTYSASTISGTLAPDFSSNRKRTYRVSMNQNLTVANPTNPQIGDELTILFQQDATGGRNVSFGSYFFKSYADTGNAAYTRAAISFRYVASNKWEQTAFSAWY